MGGGVRRAGAAVRRRQRERRALLLGGAGVAVLLLLAAALTGVMPGGRPGAVGGPFSLVADDGTRVTQRSFPGKYLLVYFGYTSCRDVCPATMNTLAAAIDRLGETAARVQPLFITLDPARDTPEVLRRYVERFGGHLKGLTGPGAALRSVADEYRVVREAAGSEIDHSSVIYLMAPDGNFVAPIPADATEMVMAQAIARLVVR